MGCRGGCFGVSVLFQSPIYPIHTLKHLNWTRPQQNKTKTKSPGLRPNGVSGSFVDGLTVKGLGSFWYPLGQISIAFGTHLDPCWLLWGSFVIQVILFSGTLFFASYLPVWTQSGTLPQATAINIFLFVCVGSLASIIYHIKTIYSISYNTM